MTSRDSLRESRSVAAWLEDYQKYWGEDQNSDFEFKLGALRKFCEFVGKNADDIIDECLQMVDGGTRIRRQKRRLYIERIKEFETSLGANEGRRWGNAVRSFLIHNGVALSAEIL